MRNQNHRALGVTLEVGPFLKETSHSRGLLPVTSNLIPLERTPTFAPITQDGPASVRAVLKQLLQLSSQ